MKWGEIGGEYEGVIVKNANIAIFYLTMVARDDDIGQSFTSDSSATCMQVPWDSSFGAC